ncbi:hypothetical protein GDO81_024763 [Engystomops pustulosus]|uniref:Uncharacterized protein n=1 Tax=Engystomops pustulosus TaxID=76066 RepID=A0AAV6YIC1_ENGPU|nr:hypothetical protein GDO81_024763 [Engystomops pustulosus]
MCHQKVQSPRNGASCATVKFYRDWTWSSPHRQRATPENEGTSSGPLYQIAHDSLSLAGQTGVPRVLVLQYGGCWWRTTLLGVFRSSVAAQYPSGLPSHLNFSPNLVPEISPSQS